MGAIDTIRENMREYDIINPIITFDGDVALSDITLDTYDMTKDIFYLNSIEDKGKNRYEAFLNKYFYDKLELGLLGKSNFNRLKPILLTSSNSDGNGRHLRFDYYLLIFNLLEDKSLNTHLNTEQLLEVTMNYYKEQEHIISDFKKRRLNSINPRVVVARFLQNNNVDMRNINDINAITYSQMQSVNVWITDSILDKFIKNIQNILRVLNNIKVEMSKAKEQETGEYQEEIKQDFMNCFNEDKFLMCYMKHVLENNKEYVKRGNGIDNSFIELTQYIHTVGECIPKYDNREKYNPSIKIYDPKTKKVINYNFNKLKEDYGIIYRKNKIATPISQLSVEQIKKMGLERNSEKMDKYREFMSKEKEEIIETDWEILAPGEQVTDVRGYAGRKPRSNDKGKKNTVSDEEIENRKFIFSQTDYSRKIVGKDKFKGYIGYIYPNGLVLFERYEEYGGLKNNATYVMNIDNFIKFSQLTKPEIIEYISNTSNPEVRRLYHNETWEKRLNETIGKIAVTDETLMRVESLPSSGKRK